MPNPHKPSPHAPLAAAVSAFEDELERFATLSAELEKTPLTSDKALVRAQKALSESTDCQARLAIQLQYVVGAIEGARVKQDGCLQQIMKAAERVRDRAREFAALVERFAGIGQRARDITEPVRAVLARKAEGAPGGELLTGLRDVLALTEAVIAEADTLSRDAKVADWPDIAREAESLKQQMQSARNRVLLAERSVAQSSS